MITFFSSNIILNIRCASMAIFMSDTFKIVSKMHFVFIYESTKLVINAI